MRLRYPIQNLSRRKLVNTHAVLLSLLLTPLALGQDPVVRIEIEKVLPLGEQYVRDISWSPTGERLVLVSGDAIAWNLAGGDTAFVDLSRVPESLCWGDDDSELIYTARDGRNSVVVRVDLPSGKNEPIRTMHRHGIRGFRKVGSYLYLSGGEFGTSSQSRCIISSTGEDVDSDLARIMAPSMIWFTHTRHLDRTLWHSRPNGVVNRIPWEGNIYGGILPNDEMELVAFATVFGTRGATIVIDVEGNILKEYTMSFMPSEWRPGSTLLVGTETQDGMHSVIASRITLVDAAGDLYVNLTDGPELDGDPVWSPDGERLAFIRVDQPEHSRGICSVVVARLTGI